MFNIGDKILYPMHGAGVIEKIEETEILGEKKAYYVLKISGRDIKIMVPVDSSMKVGVRPVASRDEVEEALSVLAAETTEMSSNWNRRYRENTEKLKSGKLDQVAEVVRNLCRADRKRKLSAVETKMLVNARQILISELVLAGEMDAEDASKLIDQAVKGNTAR
ncbi:MAG: CarD family transcriptional regulator [Firmicutes bacterium]|nr:CarD family transcriptional regulator [Bacillota bacterium]MBR2000743.1 CarD family transcriptional regulator [Bacillota bacterium]MBR4074163.1 CarD family transcriptional regulator [Bacillota bacterium]MBR7148323.1 CarD family transcriptional regulator [Bacillota bacterium]